MPINPTTLKALIDTQITDETVNFAITPAEVGGRMKDTIDYTTEQIALAEVLTNKSTNVATDGLSNTKYPSVKSVKDYADGLVVGLLDDRGNYDASTNLFPSSGGSGTAGAVMKGDLWYISVTGTLGGVSVPVGASVRALADTPAQTSTNWSILNVGLGFIPENVANKSTDVTTDGASDIKYPSAKAVKTYVDANSGGSQTLQQTVDLGNTVSGGISIDVINGSNQTIVSGGSILVTSSSNVVNVLSDSMYFEKQLGSGSVELKFPNTIDAARVINFPNASGTIALTSDIVLPYKSYVGILQFTSDGTIDEDLVFSDIVDGISYTQTGIGFYELVSNGKFTANKTIIIPFAYQGTTTNSGAVRLPIYSLNSIVGYYWLQRTTINTVLLNVVDTSQSPVNPFTLLGTRKLTIDIKVYN